ncbi:MAG: glutamine-hydrolyzing carbamoyl-phosphate synthase small subunit [Myxococcota bacterium]|nr:glutamine-hydrolyzing carbamoyl-phosphate synthase small subunit [Myxococcota bacterium]
MSVLEFEKASLVLEDGTVFVGQQFGARGDTAGEVVFNTSMTGYQEILTDPSYRRQIITMTYPHIGNYGVNPTDMESGEIQAAGFIVREPCHHPSNWRNTQSLDSWLKASGIVGIAGIDTRALVRKIRDKGAMRGAIISGEPSRSALDERLAREPEMEGRDLVKEVTCREPYEWTEGLFRLEGEQHTRQVPKASRTFHVVAFDFGIKRNILRLLVEYGCRVTVVPADTSADAVLAMEPDGVFLSNGPGDPAAVHYAIEAVSALLGKLPIFGICLGHQITALALGGKTYKMRFGHRGGNQPVLDKNSGRVEITSQNHGFAVDAESLTGVAQVSYINLNDKTVEGLVHESFPLFTVQHHPEASPGPHDSVSLFGRFVEMMESWH